MVATKNKSEALRVECVSTASRITGNWSSLHWTNNTDYYSIQCMCLASSNVLVLIWENTNTIRLVQITFLYYKFWQIQCSRLQWSAHAHARSTAGAELRQNQESWSPASTALGNHWHLISHLLHALQSWFFIWFLPDFHLIFTWFHLFSLQKLRVGNN